MPIQVKAYPIYQSLQRPKMVIGAERVLVIFSGTIASCLIFGGMNRYAFALAIIWWLTSMYFWRKLAKIDPYYIRIYLRHIKQQEFYSARASQVWRGELIGYRAR